MRIRVWFLLVFALTAVACSRHREGVIKESGGEELRVTDEELEKYVVWWRDYLTQVNRNVNEMRRMMDQVSSRYSFADTNRIAEDPDLLAMNARHRQEMQEVTNRMPVNGRKFEALSETVIGVATLETSGEKVVFVPGHNDIALAAARQKWGDDFVDWVVARESRIAEILSRE